MAYNNDGKSRVYLLCFSCQRYGVLCGIAVNWICRHWHCELRGCLTCGSLPLSGARHLRQISTLLISGFGACFFMVWIDGSYGPIECECFAFRSSSLIDEVHFSVCAFGAIRGRGPFIDFSLDDYLLAT